MGSITRACAAMGCAADKLQRSAVTDGVAAELSVMRKEGIHFAEAHRRQVTVWQQHCGASPNCMQHAATHSLQHATAASNARNAMCNSYLNL